MRDVSNTVSKKTSLLIDKEVEAEKSYLQIVSNLIYPT
jgi:hypothetical protein